MKGEKKEGIFSLETGEAIGPKEMAEARDMLHRGCVEFAPGVEDQLRDMGITKDEIIALMMRATGGLDG